MALELIIDTIEDLDPAVQSLYVKQEDDSYKLDVSGVVPESKLKEFKDKVSEFRNTNVTLQEELNKATKMEGVDIERYKQFLETEKLVKEKKLLDEGNVEEIVNLRVGEMKDNYTNQLTEKDTLLSNTQSALHKLIVTNELQTAAANTGAHPTAIADIISRGESIFKVVDGKATAMNGDQPLLNKDGEPKTISQFMETLTTEAPHLFQGATGANSTDTVNIGPKTVKYISKDQEHKFLKEIMAGEVIVKL